MRIFARIMREACGANVPEDQNPGLVLGATIAELALAKRDKITFLCSPSLAAFPSWLEQLIAESTGKDRKGLIPIANEDLGDYPEDERHYSGSGHVLDLDDLMVHGQEGGKCPFPCRYYGDGLPEEGVLPTEYQPTVKED